MCQSCTTLSNSKRERVLSCHHTAVHISTVEGADAYKCNDCGVRLTINFVPYHQWRRMGYASCHESSLKPSNQGRLLRLVY